MPCPSLHLSLTTIQEKTTLLKEALLLGLETGDLSLTLSLRQELSTRQESLKQELSLETEKKARELMGEEGFFGREEVSQALESDLSYLTLPHIPFSPQELRVAEKNGQYLILRINEGEKGTPLTMEYLKNKKEGTLRDSSLEPFATEATPTLSWALSDKELKEESKNKNYFEQTDYLQERIETLASRPQYQEALEEWQTQKEEILSLSDWKEQTKRLVALKINQLFRRTPVEALYDTYVRYQTTKEKGKKRPLEDTYDWTNVRRADGRLVGVGSFGASGARVDGYSPGIRPSILGVAFSRW
jgi:hypothetical protein